MQVAHAIHEGDDTSNAMYDTAKLFKPIYELALLLFWLGLCHIFNYEPTSYLGHPFPSEPYIYRLTTHIEIILRTCLPLVLTSSKSHSKLHLLFAHGIPSRGSSITQAAYQSLSHPAP